jgi:hypothetical protein
MKNYKPKLPKKISPIVISKPDINFWRKPEITEEVKKYLESFK